MCVYDYTASKPRPSGWLWVESQQNSEGTYSSSERLAGTSSPGSSEDLQQERRDHWGPVVTTNAQPSPAKSPEYLSNTSSGAERSSTEARVKSPVSESQQVRADWTGYGSMNPADRTVYRSTATAQLTSSQHSSPRISPLPESHRVLTPPIVKAGEMPFISDRTFPMPATTDDSAPRPQPTDKVGEIPPLRVAGLPGTGPRSPSGTSKPPPPPRTVSVKSPELLKSDSVRSYSSSSESSTFSHSERFPSSTRSYEYSDKFEASKNYREPEDSTKTRTVPVQMAYSPRQVVGDYNSQHFEYPVTDPSRREVENRSSSEVYLDDVAQSTTVVGTEPAAVDMLFSYHQMTRDTGDGQFSTSSFSSRCSPAVSATTQPSSSAPSRATVHQTHYYV